MDSHGCCLLQPQHLTKHLDQYKKTIQVLYKKGWRARGFRFQETRLLLVLYSGCSPFIFSLLLFCRISPNITKVKLELYSLTYFAFVKENLFSLSENEKCIFASLNYSIFHSYNDWWILAIIYITTVTLLETYFKIILSNSKNYIQKYS